VENSLLCTYRLLFHQHQPNRLVADHINYKYSTLIDRFEEFDHLNCFSNSVDRLQSTVLRSIYFELDSILLEQYQHFKQARLFILEATSLIFKHILLNLPLDHRFSPRKF
jgi:DnaJ-domain-containing protein 1